MSEQEPIANVRLISIKGKLAENKRASYSEELNLLDDDMQWAVIQIERQAVELTFWRSGLSASDVADNMKLWELTQND